ncbi:hypothetical protein, partial [Pseudonocardia oceani]|uniref:hypothetical protein n=1 Tax=Pseudonocardia oceani TaxID=2792013 RepID=UPI001C4A2936
AEPSQRPYLLRSCNLFTTIRRFRSGSAFTRLVVSRVYLSGNDVAGHPLASADRVIDWIPSV